MAIKIAKQKKEFQFGSLQSHAKTGGFQRAEKLNDPKENPPFFIRGVQAGSKEEYWTSLFLIWLEANAGFRWAYQVPVYGGRNVAGGNVIDFLVYTPGRWTMLEPMGRYWHTGVNEDRYELERVALFKKWRLIAWFTDETPTRESTFVKLRTEFGV